MKISELNTKSFLGAAGAATNSYVLVNYDDSASNSDQPVTYKATLHELGNAIAADLGLYKQSENDSGNMSTITAGNNTYNTQEEQFLQVMRSGAAIGYYERKNNDWVPHEVLITGSDKTVVVYDSSTSNIGYVTTNMNFTPISVGGGGFDPESGVEIETSIANASTPIAYPVVMVVDSTDGHIPVGLYSFHDSGPVPVEPQYFTKGSDSPVYVGLSGEELFAVNPDNSDPIGCPVFYEEDNGDIVLKNALGTTIATIPGA